MYPSWRYHRTLPAVIALDPSHELEVAHPDEGWSDTPASFTEPAEPEAPTAATVATVAAPAPAKKKK